jgi:hypothetical protein
MYEQTKILAALFIVLGAVIVTGLVAIPVIELQEADARCKYKDGDGTIDQNCKRKGRK